MPLLIAFAILALWVIVYLLGLLIVFIMISMLLAAAMVVMTYSSKLSKKLGVASVPSGTVDVIETHLSDAVGHWRRFKLTHAETTGESFESHVIDFARSLKADIAPTASDADILQLVVAAIALDDNYSDEERKRLLQRIRMRMYGNNVVKLMRH